MICMNLASTLTRRGPPKRSTKQSSDIIAKDWGRVAVVVAKRTGLDVMHTGPRDADVALLKTNPLLRRSFDQIPNPVRSTA